eukprot:CAMPEP_0184502676 /NCGR_PEP_ID=MMETSP0113_2-20130426/50982_1 /TAXON_ID=91329 /ORGANISM="Norrisiella sphaerica, Strain BC52" /LENGTH=431 /DNA_ID=CAMNT_0026891959 /DNA_START=105 /DNA_END=1398 /DNA_ORIENTATION=+
MYQRQRTPDSTLAGFVNLRGIDSSRRAIIDLNGKHVFRPQDGPIHVRFKGAKPEQPLLMPHLNIDLSQPSHQNNQDYTPVFSSPPPEYEQDSYQYQGGGGAYGIYSAGNQVSSGSTVVPMAYARPGIETWYPDPSDASALMGRSRITSRVHEEIPRIAPDRQGGFNYSRVTRVGYGHGFGYFHGHIQGKTPLRDFDTLNETFSEWGEKRDIIEDNKWSIFVGGLPLNLDLHHMYMAFEQFGPVDRVKTVKPRKGQPRYCGFVNMTYLDDAHRAIRTLSKVRNHTLLSKYFGKEVADEIGDGYLVLRFVGEINAAAVNAEVDQTSSSYASFQRISSDLRLLRQQMAVLSRIPQYPGYWPPAGAMPGGTMPWGQLGTGYPPNMANMANMPNMMMGGMSPPSTPPPQWSPQPPSSNDTSNSNGGPLPSVSSRTC